MKRVASTILGLLGLLAFVEFARFLDGVTAIETWLFVDLGKIWFWQLVLSASCSSFGYFVLDRVLRLGDLPALEKVTYAFALGLVGFVVGIYAGGYAGLLGPVYAVLLPLALFLVGLEPWWLALSRAWHEPAPRLSPVTLIACAFGVLGLGLVYLGVFSPDALNYDSVWNHLTVSQDYAREGRIVAFPDWMKNIPHLSSVVNTWAFIVPGFDVPPQRWMMALHDEFTVFLWTLVGVAAGARWLAARPSSRGLWAVLFLFPSIFVYDGNLGGAADHFVAFFAVPLFLAAARFLRSPSPGWAALVGALSGAALLTKFQAVYLLAPIAIAIAVRSARLATANLRGRTPVVSTRTLVKSLAVGMAVAVCVLALHFGKNAYYFRNPFYPLAQDLFPGGSVMPDAHVQVSNLMADWEHQPRGPFVERAKQAIEHVLKFSFEPHYTFHGLTPVFGSLFTLLLPALLFLRRASALWMGATVTLAGLFIWAWTYPVDRNLQALLPLMAATTAALLVRVWEIGALPRIALSLLVGLQIVWGADWAFSGADRINGALALIRSTMDGRAKQRYDDYRQEYRAIDAALPPDAFVMLHHLHSTLGIDRRVLIDGTGFQGKVDYRKFQTPGDLHVRLRELGITHVVYWPAASFSAPTKQDEVIFAAYAAMNAGAVQNFGLHSFFALGAAPPPQEPYRVATFGITGYRDGEYAIGDLSVVETYPPWLKSYPRARSRLASFEELEARLSHVDAVVLGKHVEGSTNGGEWDTFADVARKRDFTVYVRKRLIAR